MQKIAVIGSEGKFWTPKQRTKAIEKIKEIFNSHALCYGDGNLPEYNYDDVMLVSGGCGGAVSEDSYLRFSGGVDEWAEVVADFLGIQKEIKYPDINQFKDGTEIVYETPRGNLEKTLKGYESRNIEIAQICTILYCIDPANRNWSGARFTMEKARQFGKEVHLVVID